MAEEKQSGEMTRREFLIRVGGFAGLAIAGWYLLPKAFAKLTGSNLSKDGAYPVLKEDYTVREVSGGSEIYLNDGSSSQKLVCRVNDVGGSILREMNGSKSIKEIAENALTDAKTTISDSESFTGKVALFVAKLAEAGFVYAPFHVNITESEVTT